MKILQIHKYYTKERGGGSVSAFFQTKKILENRGHQVLVFSMQDKDNYSTYYSKYFAEHFDINETKSVFQKIKFAYKSVYNKEAQKKMATLIKKEKPDVAHVHNIYHYLTPAILHTLKQYQVPVVFKLSDYKVICPNYKLFNKGEICQKCKGGKYYHCFLGKCLKNSWGISFVAMAEAYIHKFLRSYEKVDCFLAPSRFMKDKCVEFGVPESKIKVLRNVLNMEEFRENKEFKEEEYFVYFGRISEEKGLKDLLQAIWKIKEKGRLGKNRLRIIGKGPQEDELARLIKKLHLEGEVSLEGFKKGEDLRNIIRKSKFTVLPSVWYDNSPMAVSEAQMLGKPVIVSDLGGTPEMVKDERTGFIFKARNVDDLADKISKMLQLSQKQRKDMGEVGRENIQEINNEDNYYNELVNIYKSFTS